MRVVSGLARRGGLWTALTALWCLALAVPPLEGQNRLPSASGDWMLRNLRPSGQPVIPLFDGWYHNPDGTFELCFGFHNLNTAQDVEIPLGPDNFIQPAHFDGLQPTHFDEVPSEYRRRFCVFTIQLEDLEEAPAIVWTLRVGGQIYSVPGSSSEHYRMDELEQSSRGNSAPLVRFDGLEEDEHRGRMMMLAEWSVPATVGVPVSLEYTVTDPNDIPLGVTRVVWGKHYGPGPVAFGVDDERVETGAVSFSHGTTATFAEPGEYLLRLQTVDWDLGNAYGFHCCWTNRYVRVRVDGSE